jgi:Kef-type K+ transport system membrane component KefB
LSFVQALEAPGSVTVVLLSLCVLASWAAGALGMAGIIGAFCVGAAMDSELIRHFKAAKGAKPEDVLRPINEFLAPIFFVVMGMGVNLKSLADSSALGLGAVLIICAVLGKLVCGLAVRRATIKRGADRLLIGFGMIPRGEVGLIFAALGSKTGVLSQSDYTAVVMMVIVTTLMAPELIAWRIRTLSKNPSARF